MEQSAFAPIQITYENRLTYQTFHKMSALWEHAFEVWFIKLPIIYGP